MASPTTRGGYDLHTHSVYSDGTTEPREIAQQVAACGLTGFALTDHDTTFGWADAREAAHEVGVDFLPGIELTTHTGTRSAHLLAYGPDPEHPELAAELQRLRGARVERAKEIASRLAYDFDLDWESVLASAGESVGRPHLADALVAGGFAVDRSAAFQELLHAQSPYYIPIYATDTVRAIEIVKLAGGVPVLGHPAAERSRTPFAAAEIEELAAAGLWGVELDHPENVRAWLPELREAAERLGLAVTGASDYHGAGKPNRIGDGTTSAELVARIRELAATPR